MSENVNQEKINQILLEVCNSFKNKTNIKKNYIEYISALLYIKYANHFCSNVSIGFDEIYEERRNFYITEIIDKTLERLREKLKNKDLFSNIKFENISVYRGIGEENFLANVIEIIYNLESYIDDESKETIIAKAYEYVLENSVMKDDIVKGQKEFYTPSYIVNVMSNITMQKNTNNIFDPYSGSGNFLLSANQNKKVNTTGIEREINIYNICMTNLLLHNIENKNIIYQDSIVPSQEQFDLILTNPPFAQRNWQEGIKREDIKYLAENGLTPSCVADYVFVLMAFKNLKKDGKMAVILPHGVLFRENETKVRQNLVKNNNIETIIGLPENMFYDNRMSVIILVLSKNKKDDKVLFVDASKEYINEGKNNILTKQMQEKLIDVCKNRKEIACYSHLASMEEIEKNSFNLTIKRYVKEAISKKEILRKSDIILELENLEKEKDILEENINDVLEVLGVTEIFEKREEIEKKESSNQTGHVNYYKMGQKIKEARIAKNYTQEELSEKLEISLSYLSRIEKGNSHLTLQGLVKICDLLDITVGSVLN